MCGARRRAARRGMGSFLARHLHLGSQPRLCSFHVNLVLAGPVLEIFISILLICIDEMKVLFIQRDRSHRAEGRGAAQRGNSSHTCHHGHADFLVSAHLDWSKIVGTDLSHTGISQFWNLAVPHGIEPNDVLSQTGKRPPH